MLHRQYVNRNDQVEILERLNRARDVGHRVQQVRAIDDERLDRVRFARNHRLDQFLHGRRTAQEFGAGAIGARFAGRTDGQFRAFGARLGRTATGAAGDGKGRMGIRLDIGRLVEVETTLAPVRTEQRVDRVGRTHALRVVAVPRHMAPRHDQRLRQAVGHDACRRADQLRVEFRDGGRPLGRQVGDMGGQLVEAVGPLRNIVGVVALLGDQHVDPRQQQRRVGAGLDGQPVVGLGGHAGETWVDHDHLGAAAPGLGKVLHHRVA